MANLYDKAGLVNIPVGYQDGFLYNIKPEDNTLGFRFNRDSAATRVNKEGLIEQVGYFGPELIINGDFATDTSWGKLNAIISGGKATVNVVSGAYSYINQSESFTSGKKYKITAQVKGLSGSNAKEIRFRDNSANTGGLNTSNGIVTLDESTQNIKLEWVANSNSVEIIIERNTSAGDYSFEIDNVSVVEVLGDKPRIDYTDSLTSPNFLLEPQSTNLLPYSEDFSQWTKEATVTLTSNYGISPDGTKNSTRIQMDANDSIYISTTSGNTFSVYIKGKQGETIRLANGGSLTHTLTGEWDRVSLYDSGNFSSLATINTYSSATARDVEIFGAQIEALSYTSSYIPTAGSTVTRTQETCLNAGSSYTFNSVEGVLYAEIAALDDDGTFRVLSINNGTNDNTIKVGYRTTSNAIYYEVRSGGVSQAFQIYTTADIKQFHKVAVLYQQNNFKLFINGVNVLSDTNGITPVGLNNLSFDVNSVAPFYGKVKGVCVFNEVLTDDELQQLTGPEYNSFAALAAAYNYTVI